MSHLGFRAPTPTKSTESILCGGAFEGLLKGLVWTDMVRGLSLNKVGFIRFGV